MTSPLFRDPFRRRRCLVPVDGFYEWRRDGPVRRPVWIHDPSGSPLALAGLWTGRQDPETGEWRRTFTIVTTRPNEVMAAIHDRMPVVVPRDAWARWLDPVAGDLSASCGRSSSRATTSPSTCARCRMLVNNVRNDGPALIEAIPETAETSPVGKPSAPS